MRYAVIACATRFTAGALLIVTGIASSAACAKKAPDEQVAPNASSEPVTTSATVAPPSSTVATPAMAATATLGLFERLAKEKSSRPSGTPRAEEVIAAMGKAGVPLQDESQVYAATVKASYCEAAKGANVFVSICEFAGETEAKEGRDFSVKTFAAIKNRQIFVNKKTTMTVAQTAPTPKGDADTKKMADVFAKL